MSMNPNQAPRSGLLGLLDRVRRPDEETGLNFANRLGMAASVLNPMNPQSANYRQQMMQSGQARMQGQARNRTIAELQKRADAGDTIAARYLAAVQTGAVEGSAAFGGYLSDLQARDLNNARLGQNRYVVVGNTLVDRNTGEPIFTAPSSQQSSGSITMPDGTIISLGKQTENQSGAMVYGSRMDFANKILANTEEVGTELGQQLYNKIPIFGNALTSTAFKSYDNARRNFVNAVLRRESGAAIAESEFESANQQYFPQPFDPPELVAQKRATRELATAMMMSASGPNATEYAKAEAEKFAKALNPLYGTSAYEEQRKKLDNKKNNDTTTPAGNQRVTF